jgi:aryl-alcohol dehydrogenase (NADP+)
MKYVNLGHTGLKVSRLCLGCMTYGSSKWRPWVLDEEASRPFFRRAFEAGINFVDTADMYSIGASEEVTGRAIRDFAKRHEIVLATKVFNPLDPKDPNGRGLSRKHVMQGIDDSLRRLGTDYIDLYQIHRWDYRTPIEETMEALHDVVKAGKALYIGASSMFAWQFAKAQNVAALAGTTRFVAMQNHWNLVYREEEREMVPMCRDMGVGIIPWSPLARGFLAGNRRPQGGGETTRATTDEFAAKLYYQPEDFDVADRVAAIAEARGVQPTQVALAWLLQKPGLTAPIIGASKLDHLDAALASLDVTLTAEEVTALEAPYKPHPVLGHE